MKQNMTGCCLYKCTNAKKKKKKEFEGSTVNDHRSQNQVYILQMAFPETNLEPCCLFIIATPADQLIYTTMRTLQQHHV